MGLSSSFLREVESKLIISETVPGMLYFENREFITRLPPTDPHISTASSFVVLMFKVSFKPVVVSFCCEMLVNASSSSCFFISSSRLLMITAVFGFPVKKV